MGKCVYPLCGYKPHSTKSTHPKGCGYNRAGLKPAPTCSCHPELCLLHTYWGVSGSQIHNIQFTIINLKSPLFKVPLFGKEVGYSSLHFALFTHPPIHSFNALTTFHLSLSTCHFHFTLSPASSIQYPVSSIRYREFFAPLREISWPRTLKGALQGCQL